jgi:hypothetical protein
MLKDGIEAVECRDPVVHISSSETPYIKLFQASSKLVLSSLDYRGDILCHIDRLNLCQLMQYNTEVERVTYRL